MEVIFMLKSTFSGYLSVMDLINYRVEVYQCNVANSKAQHVFKDFS